MEKRKQLIFLEDSKGIVKTKNKNGYLYLLSDDEIKEGDWCLQFHKTNTNIPINVVKYKNYGEGNYYFKKIIATTDSSLEIFDKELSNRHSVKVNILLPQLSKQFIEKYIEEYNKGNVITDVLVEYESDFNSCFCTKDICNGNNCPKKLKVNPKDNSLLIILLINK